MSDNEATEVAEQTDVPIGGALDGDLPAAAVNTSVVGIVTTREVPTLEATFGKLVIASGTAQRIGRDTRRRRLLLSVRPHATATAYVCVGDNQQQAISDYGWSLLQGATAPALNYAGEVWIAAVGADLVVGFVAEQDY